VPLVNGWPEAAYWHTETQSIDSACSGQVETNNLWLAKAGYGIGDTTVTPLLTVSLTVKS
jgi:hypothetical protein